MTAVAEQRAITYRAALDADGPALGDLAVRCGVMLDDLDWSHVQPYWLVAEQDGQIIGMVQLCPSLPIAGLEHLCVDPSLRLIERGLIVKHLLYAGCGALERMGAQYVRGMIPYDLGSYMDTLTHHGAVEITQGALFVKRIRV